MLVLLVVERSKEAPGIGAMVWTAVEDDPRLLDSRQFKGEAALTVWLAGIATRYGRENIRVHWTGDLCCDSRLTVLLEESVGAVAPRPAGGQG